MLKNWVGKLSLGLVAIFAMVATVNAGPPLFVIKTADGTVNHEVDLSTIEKIGTTEITTEVLTYEETPRPVKGVLVRDLFKYFDIDAKVVTAKALDTYSIEIPASDFINYPVIIAYQIDGRTLSVREKGPAWIIYPVTEYPALNSPVYQARSVWQLNELVLK